MESKKVTWLELFSDLLFVAAIATVTGVLIHVEDGEIPFTYIFKFILIFIPIWWSWVGQTLFTNRFGEDGLHHRLFMILQMIFALVMIASLSTDFDSYFLPFVIGYLGLRVLTALQYMLAAKLETGAKKDVASYLGKYFWVGIIISFCSIFFDDTWRYVILYAGIAVDIIIPLFGRKHLKNSPVDTEHLIERFSQFTTILFGEMLVGTIIIIQPHPGDWHNILYGALFFILIISMGWQYFDNLDIKVNKAIKSTGQLIIYGHLFILIAISMLTISIRLLFEEKMDIPFILTFIFVSMATYVVATIVVFQAYRYTHTKLQKIHFVILGLLLACFIAMIFIQATFISNFFILVMMVLFFVIYAFISLK
ncbi:low temperature requirement protein A [Kurthia senegalensis]|uniref:low temperature requirement protein A n=1 Tax=Kurthia senegalensis TaxID=1033740 RepID=UPI000289E3BA|nr:low temperature requirement protein A [Kurthia senegalensis]